MKNVNRKFLAVLMTCAMLISLGSMAGVRTSSAAKKPKLNKSSSNLYIGGALQLKVKNAPKKASVVWKASNKKVSIKKKGKWGVKVTALHAGKATVTATIKTGKKKIAALKCKVGIAIKFDKPKEDTTNVLASPVTNANGMLTYDNGMMRTDYSSWDMMNWMGLGWNLGNSLEAVPDSSTITASTTVTDCETSWGTKPVTQENISALKQYGFKTVRIPVAWSNLMGSNYTIHPDYFKRVEEVMNYCLKEGMYVIINIHYDGDWWGQFGDADSAVREQAWARYESFWTQIAARYKDYSDHVIFESANEELGDRLNDDWRNQSTANKTGTLTLNEQYQMIHDINQKFVDIVRASGGNNASRYLLIAGYNTDVAYTCDKRYVMPTDLEQNGTSKLSVSVHYYTPWNYCGGAEYSGTDKMLSWGTADDIKLMHSKIDSMDKFIEKGYGVIWGEFGVQSTGVDGVDNFFEEFISYSMKKGTVPVLWDTGTWFSRTTNSMNFDNIAQVFCDTTGVSFDYPKSGQDTGYKAIETLPEDQLTKMYEWSGTWVKNDGSNASHKFEQTSCSPGLEVYVNNKWFYWIEMFADWSALQEPYMKITVSDDAESGLMLGYANYRDAAKSDKENMEKTMVYTIDYTDGWYSDNEKNVCFKLDKSMLAGKDALYMTFANGPTITKIEIFDKKA